MNEEKYIIRYEASWTANKWTYFSKIKNGTTYSEEFKNNEEVLKMTYKKALLMVEEIKEIKHRDPFKIEIIDFYTDKIITKNDHSINFFKRINRFKLMDI